MKTPQDLKCSLEQYTATYLTEIRRRQPKDSYYFGGWSAGGMNGKTPPSWLRPHFDAFIQMLDDYKVKPFTGRTPEVLMIYAKDGICKRPSDPRPEIRRMTHVRCCGSSIIALSSVEAAGWTWSGGIT